MPWVMHGCLRIWDGVSAGTHQLQRSQRYAQQKNNRIRHQPRSGRKRPRQEAQGPVRSATASTNGGTVRTVVSPPPLCHAMLHTQ